VGPACDETEGLKGALRRRNVFDFYTTEGACALADFFRHWDGGRLVVNIAEMPIKCPVAPLEFVFPADWFFTERGIRSKVDINFLRKEYAESKTIPALRKVGKRSGVDVKGLYRLFPDGPVKKAAYIAGLPKPRSCV